MLPDRVSNPGPLTYESGALPTGLRGPKIVCKSCLSSFTTVKKILLKVPKVVCKSCLSSFTTVWKGSKGHLKYRNSQQRQLSSQTNRVCNDNLSHLSHWKFSAKAAKALYLSTT